MRRSKLAQGRALGLGIQRLLCALKGRWGPLRAFSADDLACALYPGRCPGLASSAPLARNGGRSFEREFDLPQRAIEPNLHRKTERLIGRNFSLVCVFGRADSLFEFCSMLRPDSTPGPPGCGVEHRRARRPRLRRALQLPTFLCFP